MKNTLKISPYIKIIFSFFAVILIGAFLLMLPISSQNSPLSFIEAFFTSTSAVCVTGLSVIPDVGATLSIFGKVVLALLIEIGGLGFITIAMFVLIIFKVKIGIKDRFLMKEAFNQNEHHGMVKMVKTVIITALIIQGIGFVVNFFIMKFSLNFNVAESIGYGIFHTISAFNNAGFDLFGNNSLIDYANNIYLNLSTASLIILGGIGFIVIFDILHNRKWKKFSMHTKIVLSMSATLIISGTILFYLTTDMNILEAFFQSVSARTAGFATYDMSQLKKSSAFIIMIFLMFVGASPCSTGGGVKTTTFYVILKTIFCNSLNKPIISHNRKIADTSIFKAFSLTMIAFIFVITSICMISTIESFINQSSITLADITFETFSAFGTVGLSTGITPTLHWTSKLIICFVMFMGRLGPLTIFSVWSKKHIFDSNTEVRFVEKQVIIG